MLPPVLRFEQQSSVDGATSQLGSLVVGESHCPRDEASPAGHRFTLPAASLRFLVVSWSPAWSSIQVSPTGA